MMSAIHYGNNSNNSNSSRRAAKKPAAPAKPYTGHAAPVVEDYVVPNPEGFRNPGFAVKVPTTLGPRYLTAAQVVSQGGKTGYLEPQGNYGNSHNVFREFNVTKYPVIDLNAQLAANRARESQASAPPANASKGFLQSAWNTCTGVFCPKRPTKRGGQRKHRKTLKRSSKRR